MILAFIVTLDHLVGSAAVRSDSSIEGLVDRVFDTRVRNLFSQVRGNDKCDKDATGCCEMEALDYWLFWVLAVAIFGVILQFAALGHKYLQPRVEKEVNMISTWSVGDTKAEETSLDLKWYTIKFNGKQAEKQWYEYAESTKIKDSALILFWIGVVACIYQTLEMGQNLQKHGHDYLFFNCVSIVAALAVTAAARLCSRYPSERLYWSLLVFFFFFIPAVQLHPFTASCRKVQLRTLDALKHQLWRDAELRHFDCALPGHSSMQILITWILVQPWVIMHLEHIHVVWFWVLGVLPGWTMLDFWFTECTVFLPEDMLMRWVLLIIAQIIACIKKYTLEKSRRLKFLQSLQEKSSSKKMYSILSLMMPKHVIGTMIKEPNTVIANEISKVSILFVLITDVERLVPPEHSAPWELLKFLNDQFTQMDMICAKHGVAKIETVAEEYVAAVGVLPDDIQENKAGHNRLLERLLKAAGEIMCRQTEEVKYKMGIHTGPIYAGVIGGKLPRYRLFGDTINTAARMMQKCERGMLQFGKETFQDVPVSMRNEVRLRGDVEMKGKGMVTTYVYSPDCCVTDTQSSLSTPGKQHRRRYEANRKMSIAFQEFTAEWVSETEEADRQFEETLRGHHVSNDQSATKWRLFLSEKDGFTHEMEKEWFKWYHEHTICHKIVRRLGTQATVVLVVTGIEFLIFVYDQSGRDWGVTVWDPRSRLIKFVYLRLFVLLGNHVLWLLSEFETWMQVHAKSVQCLLLMNSIFDIMAVYISYLAMFVSNDESFIQRQAFSGRVRVPVDQLLTLNFVLFVFLFMRTHALLFWPSCLFIPVTGGCIFAPSIVKRLRCLWCALKKSTSVHTISEGLSGMGESMYALNGEFFFMIMVFVFVALAHSEEDQSRQRYKLKHAVESMSERTEHILKNMMPNKVVNSLQDSLRGQEFDDGDLALSTLSHKYRHATIAQSDLCGFTALVSNTRKTPKEVMEFLTDLFGKFDKLADVHGVYKVETVGDAYIAGMAEPPLTDENSPYSAILFGLDMVRAVDDWAQKMKVDVACRVGIHHGECIGGIVGTEMQRYHLFGDMLAVLEILESTALEGRVQVSAACKREVEREIKDDPCMMRREKIDFVQREGAKLRTSKGLEFEFDTVGGTTFLVTSNKDLRHLPKAKSPPSLIQHEMRQVTKQKARTDSKDASGEGCK